MILLYKDPKGAQVGTTLQITTDATQTGSGGTEMTKVNLELESKVASLEKLITELRNENETLKVSDSNSVYTLRIFLIFMMPVMAVTVQ